MAGAALLTPAAAEAQTVYVSNLGETSADNANNITVANAFTTGGTSTDRFSLTSVVVDYTSNATDSAVSIHTESSGNPGTRIGTFLTRQVSSNNGQVTFNAPSIGITLNGATTYFVVIIAVDDNPPNHVIKRTASDDEDTGSTAGWSIADDYHVQSGNNWISQARALLIRVNAATLRAPTNVQAQTGSQQVSLSWNAVPGATGYEYQQRTQATGTCSTTDADYGAWTTAGTASPFAVTGLSDATRYCFRVRTEIGSLDSAASTAVVATTLLAAPTNVMATAGNGQVSLSWNAVTGATGYQFQQKTLASGACGTSSYGNWTTAGTASPHVVTSLMNGTRYCFRVRGVNGSPSVAVDATPAMADTAAPTVTTYSPADNATGVAVGANLSLTFNEAVQKGTGNITIRRTSDNTDINIAVTSNQVTIGGTGANLNRIVTINPTADLDANTAYHVRIPSGVITDRAATPNNYAGISDATTWNFTTVDTAAPTVTAYSPADNATGVAVGANLSLTFNEPVQKGTGNITIRRTSDNTDITIAVTSNQVTIGGTGANLNRIVTINPTADLDANTAYHMRIPSGAITDRAATPNNYAGISDATTWNFTTVDNVAPTVVSNGYSPADDATNARWARISPSPSTRRCRRARATSSSNPAGIQTFPFP